MKSLFSGLLGKSEVVNNEKVEQSRQDVVKQNNVSQPSGGMDNLIKMKEAMALIKASAPTVRKYARLGYYSEYRFGEKLVFYNKEEMLNFILKGQICKK